MMKYLKNAFDVTTSLYRTIFNVDTYIAITLFKILEYPFIIHFSSNYEFLEHFGDFSLRHNRFSARIVIPSHW